MPITREPDYPVEAAQLLQAFNRCADGHSFANVLNASIQMLAASIGYLAREQNLTLEQAQSFALGALRTTFAEVIENYKRSPKPTDIPVNLG